MSYSAQMAIKTKTKSADFKELGGQKPYWWQHHVFGIELLHRTGKITIEHTKLITGIGVPDMHSTISAAGKYKLRIRTEAGLNGNAHERHRPDIESSHWYFFWITCSSGPAMWINRAWLCALFAVLHDNQVIFAALYQMLSVGRTALILSVFTSNTLVLISMVLTFCKN